MSLRLPLFAAGFALLLVSPSAHAARRVPVKDALSASAVNRRTGHPILNASSKDPAAVLRAQVLLDRAHFSPGEIDGRFGGTTGSAVAAFNLSNKIKGGATVSAATWKALNLDTAAAIVAYTLTAADLAGPFVPMPEEMADKAKLPALGFESLAEALGEKFHVSPAMLAALNPKTKLDRAGVVIQVPGVTRPPLEKTAGMSIRVSKGKRSVEVVDGDRVVARYPATTGSEHDPLPEGNWKINGVAWNPPYNYNPDLFWDAEASEQKAKLAPGPNSPVGVAWVDLSKPHYGIHGTPVPSAIGKTSSHGCIRLTNWDVTELAKVVEPGMAAVLER